MSTSKFTDEESPVVVREMGRSSPRIVPMKSEDRNDLIYFQTELDKSKDLGDEAGSVATSSLAPPICIF